MKRLVSWLLLIAMLAVVGLWSSLPTEAQEEEAAPQCNCYYPNTGRFGVIRWGDCGVTDCWLPIPKFE